MKRLVYLRFALARLLLLHLPRHEHTCFPVCL